MNNLYYDMEVDGWYGQCLLMSEHPSGSVGPTWSVVAVPVATSPLLIDAHSTQT